MHNSKKKTMKKTEKKPQSRLATTTKSKDESVSHVALPSLVLVRRSSLIPVCNPRLKGVASPRLQTETKEPFSSIAWESNLAPPPTTGRGRPRPYLQAHGNPPLPPPLGSLPPSTYHKMLNSKLSVEVIVVAPSQYVLSATFRASPPSLSLGSHGLCCQSLETTHQPLDFNPTAREQVAEISLNV